MTARSGGRVFRIGELAALTGTTPRTIRYYEEIGLLSTGGHSPGKHRVYTEADVERLDELTRIRDLLGLSLAELKSLVDFETARADLRGRYRETEDRVERARLLREGLGQLDGQLGLLSHRRAELRKLERELSARRRKIAAALDELQADND